jgi:type I restriction enzyme, S subunit
MLVLKLKNGYKKTKFGFIPDDWEIKRLKDIGTSTIGLTYSPSDVVDKGGTLVLRSSNINDGRLSFLDNVYVKKDIPKKLILKKGDILVCSRNGSKSLIGKNALIAEDTNFTFGAFMSVFRSKYNQYLYQLFQTEMYKKQIVANLGATINQITTKDINSFQFPFPKNDKEQKKIVSILSTWDKAIELKEKLIEQKKEQKKGLMQKLLTGEVRLPGFEGRWKKEILENVATVIMGQSPPSSSYNEIQKGLPLIQGNADCQNRKTSPKIWTSQPTKNCQVGDIIMTVRAPVGMVSRSLHEACIGRGVCAIRSKINQDFLYYQLISIENMWGRISQGSTFESINSNDIKGLEIRVPSLEEQVAISNVLLKADHELDLHERELNHLKKQKKGLMQLLLTGKIRVKL